MNFKDIIKGIEKTSKELTNIEETDDDYYFDQWSMALKLYKMTDQFYIRMTLDYPKNTVLTFLWPGTEQEYIDMADFLFNSTMLDVMMIIIYLMNKEK